MTKIFTLSVKNWKTATLFIVSWFVLMNLLFMISPQLSEVTTNNQDDFLPSDSESVSAMKVRFEKFPSADGIPAIVALRSYINPSTNQTDIERTNLGILNFVDLLRSDLAPKSISSVISPIEDPSLSSGNISMIISQCLFTLTKVWIKILNGCLKFLQKQNYLLKKIIFWKNQVIQIK